MRTVKFPFRMENKAVHNCYKLMRSPCIRVIMQTVLHTVMRYKDDSNEYYYFIHNQTGDVYEGETFKSRTIADMTFFNHLQQIRQEKEIA